MSTPLPAGRPAVTSRAKTPMLARAHGADGHFRRSPADWAMIGLFGVLNAPFLAKSLYGGSEKAKTDLLNRLNLPEAALPHTGGWKADVGLLAFLADHILAARPKSVVEFGAGATTLVISRALDMAGVVDRQFASFEQHEDFCAKTTAWLDDFGARSDIHYAPLKTAPDPWPGLWYDHGPLPDLIDLMLIDGPPWTVHPFTRGSAEKLFDRISVGGVVLLDDAARPGERVVARRWRRLWPQFDFRLHHFGSKGTLVGRRLR